MSTSSAARRPQRQGGFTLIEMLVVAPMIILLIAAAIAAITSLTGQSLVLQTRNEMTYNLQNALNDIENDAVKATAFVQTSGVLPSPQGSDNNFTGTAAFTSDTALVMGVLGTDVNPLDPAHQIIYYANQPNPCGSTAQINRTFITKVIYYVYNGSLWRRSIVPSNNTSNNNDYTTCGTPWQRNSCSPGYTNTSQCKTEDVEEFKGVTSFTVQYYAAPDSTSTLTAANARQAKTVVVTLNGSQTIAGQTVTVGGSTRATRLNDIDADLTAPSAAPTVTYSLNATQAVTFSWNAIPNATSYQVSYTQNGVTTNVGRVPGTSYTILTTRLDSITFNVAAHNYQGDSATTTTSITIPSAAPCQLQNGWTSYTGGYGDMTFTKTSAGVVVLSGLIKNLTVAGNTFISGQVICNLPVGYRPSANKGALSAIITDGTNYGTTGRLEVRDNGDVIIYGNSNWASLDGVSFMPSGQDSAMTAPSLQNGWTNWGDSRYRDAAYMSDTAGRLRVQGLLKMGTSTNNTLIFNVPAAKAPSAYEHHITITGCNGTGYGWGFQGITANGSTLGPSNAVVAKDNDCSGNWKALNILTYPASYGGWNNLTLNNSWVNSGAPFSTARYTKGSDGIVMLKGFVTSGSTALWANIATLPAGQGLCPATAITFPVVSSVAIGRVNISAGSGSGCTVQVINVSNSWLSLDNVYWVGTNN